MRIPILTERLVVRNLEQEDAERMFRYRSNPSIYRFQLWEPSSVEEVLSFIETSGGGDKGRFGAWRRLGLFLRTRDQMVGDCGYRLLAEDPSQAEIAVTVAPEFQGQGFGREAVRALLDILFREEGKRRVFASVDPENTAAVALFKHVGMRAEALFIESLQFKGKWADDMVFGLLAREYKCVK
ncbi:MAG: GNAT family N-acetyltransferase [Synergistales bacterium]